MVRTSSYCTADAALHARVGLQVVPSRSSSKDPVVVVVSYSNTP